MSREFTAVEQHLSDRLDSIVVACETLIRESNEVLEIYDKIYNCDDKPIEWPSPDCLAIAINAARKATETQDTLSRQDELRHVSEKAARHLIKNKAESFENQIVLNKKVFSVKAEVISYD